MVEWIPVLLIILGWNPDAPGDGRVMRVEVTIDETECNRLGDEFVASHKMHGEKAGSPEPRFFCVPMPDSEAVERAWQRRIEQRKGASARQ